MALNSSNSAQESQNPAVEPVETRPVSVDIASRQNNTEALRNAGFQGFLKSARRFVTRALVAAAPFVLGSCVGETDMSEQDETQSYGNVGGAPAQAPVESVSWKDRQVMLNYDGKDWHFEGRFPKDFHLTVDVDGKRVFDEKVVSKNGTFNVKGLAGETVKDIKIQAFDPNGTDMQSFNIPIEPKIETKGMYGVDHFHNVEY